MKSILAAVVALVCLTLSSDKAMAVTEFNNIADLSHAIGSGAQVCDKIAAQHEQEIIRDRKPSSNQGRGDRSRRAN